MPRGLHVRLLVLLAALLIPTGALFLAASLRGARSYHQEIVQRQNLQLAENLVGQNESIELGTQDDGALPDLVKMLAMANPGVEIYLLDDRLQVVQGPPDAELAARTVSAAPLERFRAAVAGAPETFPILGTDPRRGGTVAFSAAPLPSGSGWLYVVLTDASRASLARSVQNSATLRLLLWGGALGFAVLLAVGAISFSVLTRRLRTLADDVQAFRLGGSDAQSHVAPPERRRDEIDELRHGFALLASRARSQYRELERADARRRELVTNVSHDLRTPLTALRGYLEAMDGAEEERARAYLAAAQRSAARLGRLIDQLFELSRLEGQVEPMWWEAFPPQELVSDVTQKFALQAERQGIDLAIAADPSLPFVRGDLGAIERALSNLLENALRHTPSGGAVRICVYRGESGVAVAVEDSGPGIAAEDVERVFERFYRVEVGRSGEGSGLGLAIAKRVVELHGGSIGVTRGGAGGARFWFTLPEAGPVNLS